MSRADPPDVTPDLVVQVTNDYGVIAEMKKHVHDGDIVSFDQVAKVSMPTSTRAGGPTRAGSVATTWCCSPISPAAHALRTPPGHGSPTDIPTAARSPRLWSTASPTGASLWFFLRRVFGELSDPEHDEALSDIGKSMPEHISLKTLSPRRSFTTLCHQRSIS